ncbi:glycosyl hydrolase family 28-related protein [Microbacterium sp. ZW CA_36]|uniref:glycosyl hydrolase family 28-related protein n=1 Tax=Microbacterium sp. ZW CA_36 TaxID=3378078 RepID=UPI003851E106
MSTLSRRHVMGAAGIAALGATMAGQLSPSQPAAAAEATADALMGTTPQEFGAVGDGVADDTDAIQQAIDAQLTRPNKIVFFPPGTYRITRTLVVPDVEGLGGDNFNRIVLAGASTMSSRVSIIDVDFDGTGLEMRAPLAALRGLCFVAPASLKNTVAVQSARDANRVGANTDDVDLVVTECTFIEFYLALRHVGRGLVFTNNLVAVGDFGIDISWPTAGVSGTGVHLLPYGMRKWLIEGNHFHSMGTAIRTTGENAGSFRGAIIANNVLDIGRRLFEGGIINSTFTGNVVENGSGGALINITAGGTNLTFTGNVLGGGEPTGGGRPPYSIAFDTAVQARNVAITGNTFNWVTRSPVYFAAAAAEITISGNSFDNWNLDQDERWGAVRINGDATDVSLLGNLFGANPVTEAPPVRVTGTLTRSTITGNTFDNTAGVVWAQVIGADNVIERRRPGAMEQEVTAAANAAIVVRATTTGVHDVGADAYGAFVAASDQSAGAGPGVKGGMRVVPVNEVGSTAVDLLCSTDDENGVAAMRVDITGITPTADNARDLGSAENRMRTVFAHGVQLAAGPRPQPALGAMAMVTDAAGTSVLAVSDGTRWLRVVLGNPV